MLSEILFLYEVEMLTGGRCILKVTTEYVPEYVFKSLVPLHIRINQSGSKSFFVTAIRRQPLLTV